MRSSCPFCRSNSLLDVPVLAETEGAYLIRARFSPGNYLIIPSVHAESPAELPDTWWQAVKELLPRVPNLGEQYNLSLNIGRDAGQTVKHLHFWVVPRASGQPASGKGLAGLISEVNK